MMHWNKNYICLILIIVSSSKYEGAVNVCIAVNKIYCTYFIPGFKYVTICFATMYFQFCQILCIVLQQSM